MPSMQTVLINQNFHADDVTDTESQTDEEVVTPSTSALDLLTKCLEMLRNVAAGGGCDGYELRGFPNIFSAQRLMVQQSQQTPSTERDPSEMEIADNFSNKIQQSLMFHNTIISLKQFRKPTKVEECDEIIDYWTLYFPLSKLKRFFSIFCISSKVLLQATQGLIVDSEFLSCDLVDMKWTFFLEGALAQSNLATLDGPKLSMNKMKNLLQDYNNSRLNAIQQNKAIIANTERYNFVLENFTIRLYRLFHLVTEILGTEQQTRCRLLPSNFAKSTMLPRSIKLPLPKTYLIYFKGIKIHITPILGHRNKIQIEGDTHNADDKHNSALMLAMEPLLLAGAEELQILHQRDLNMFFELGQGK